MVAQCRVHDCVIASSHCISASLLLTNNTDFIVIATCSIVDLGLEQAGTALMYTTAANAQCCSDLCCCICIDFCVKRFV